MKNADLLELSLVCKAYRVVLESVCIMRWDSELEEGVFVIIWCSGVVTGPRMLTADKLKRSIQPIMWFYESKRLYVEAPN